MVNSAQLRALHPAFKRIGMGGEENREARLEACAVIIGHEIGSSSDLTRQEWQQVMATLDRCKSRADLELLLHQVQSGGELPPADVEDPAEEES